MVYPVCSVLLQNCLKDFTQLTFWGFSISYPSSNHVPRTVLLPTLGYVVEYTNFQASVAQSNYHTAVLKSVSPSNSSFSTFSRLHHSGAMQISVDVGEVPGFGKHFQPKLDHDSMDDYTLNEVMLDSSNDSSKSPRDHNKRRKRKREVHGNKGRVPWNKGRKHTAETRALIKKRTIEALRDPQVRKKMREHPHTHSDEIKKKIGSSQRQLWDKRLKWKKLREKFFLSWTKSVAELAGNGGVDQQELDWDSYDKLKEEIIQQQLKCAMGKAKAKELADITAEKAAQTKVEKMAKLAQKRKEQEKKAKAREGTKKKAYRKSEKSSYKLSDVQELTLKERLTKIRKKKSINNKVITQGKTLVSHSPAWKKLDLEIIKGEIARRKISLADQIQAAKNKRLESCERKTLAEPYTDKFFTGRLLD